MPSNPKTRSSLYLFTLGVLAALLEGLLLLLTRYHPLDENIPEVVAIFLAAGSIYFLAVHLTWQPETNNRAGLILILVAAAVFRITLFPLPPTLSDDIHRYLWEGRIQQAGLNPYSHAPSGPEVEAFRPADLDSIPGKDVSAAYGPGTELLFNLAARFGGLYVFKFTSLLFDLASLLLLVLLLRARGEPLMRVLVYGWCPLVILEFAGSAHIDSAMVALLLLALWLLHKKQNPLSIAAITAALFTKWTAGLALPLFFRRTNWRAGPVFAAVAFLLYLPYLDAGSRLVAGMGAYTEKWRNNESLHALLTWLTGQDAVAQGVLGGVLLGLLAYLTWKKTDPLRATYLLLGTLLLLSPNVFPWYMTWLVPFLCFFPQRAFLLWTSTALLGYHVMIRYSALGIWEYQAEMLWLEYAPVYGLLLWSWWRNSQSPASPPVGNSQLRRIELQ